ncbi:hypothetical protein BJ322DRAFT_414347 [Thelephora terrestris]|uniref:Uncharacterized protein n=1 Tax=Thelephora terrestris TaxID=56493 RepID=A0A9P6LBH1_9AGAM|nr:hypothetical protein BJ322DRAFT_414347 [Thelephora terrestris]
MKLLSVVALLSAVGSSVNAIMVNTPASAVECQPLLVTWDPQGSAGPFFLSVVPGTSPSSPALFSWSNLTGTSFTWVVAEPSGTSLGLLLRDQTGNTSQSAPFTVQAGSATCLNSTSSVSQPPASSLSSLPSSSSSTTTTSTSTTKPATPTTTPVRPSSSSSSGSSSPSSTPSTSGNTSGGVLSNVVNFGSVGLFAVFVGVILA